MNAQTEVTLDQVHEAITAKIKEQFPDLRTVEAYRMDRKSLPVPACLLNLMEMEVDTDNDPGTEQLAVTAHFEAVFVIGFRQGSLNPKLEIRKLATSFATFCQRQRWGLPVGPAQVETISEDGFDPDLDQFECWRVEWSQVLHLGASVWNDEGTTPTEIFLSQVPEIGTEHEDDYVQIASAEELPHV